MNRSLKHIVSSLATEGAVLYGVWRVLQVGRIADCGNVPRIEESEKGEVRAQYKKRSICAQLKHLLLDVCSIKRSAMDYS